jgi:hypothetical protein
VRLLVSIIRRTDRWSYVMLRRRQQNGPDWVYVRAAGGFPLRSDAELAAQTALREERDGSGS